MSIQELEAEALKLPEKQRAMLTERLLASLGHDVIPATTTPSWDSARPPFPPAHLTPRPSTIGIYTGGRSDDHLRRRGRHAKAVEIADRLLTSPSVHVVHVDESLFRSAFALLAGIRTSASR